jgi:hypothetical protein
MCVQSGMRQHPKASPTIQQVIHPAMLPVPICFEVCVITTFWQNGHSTEVGLCPRFFNFSLSFGEKGSSCTGVI